MFISQYIPQDAIFWRANQIWYYPWTQAQCKIYFKFYNLVTFYNNFHIHVFERIRNPYGRNTKILGNGKNLTFYQQIPIGSHSKKC